MRNVSRLFLIAIMSLSLTVSAQKSIAKSLDARSLNEIDIHGEGFFKIETATHSIKQIEIQAQFEGEYFNENIIQIKSYENSLMIGLDWSPAFARPDDKLAAHKRNSARLKVIMPEGINLNLVSNSGTLLLKGKYKNLKIELNEANCQIRGIADNAEINSSDGDILVWTKNAWFDALSRHGSVSISEKINGKAKWKLRSNNGNIRIRTPE